MRRDLPGFYWDEDKNRYFPLSSRPTKPLPVLSARAIPLKQTQQLTCQLREPYASLKQLGSAHGHSELSRIHHRLASSVMASTVNQPVHTRTFPQTISAFSTMLLEDQTTYTMVGDNKGWLYSVTEAPHQPSPEFSLPTAISSISSSGHICVATTFGSPCKIVVYNGSTAETFILNPSVKFVYDVWVSHFRDHSLALGMHNKGIFLPDINISRGFQALNTYSDVLAIYQEPNLVYTGTRGGILSRWDTRTNTADEKDLLSNRYLKKSIIHVQTLDDYRLIVSAINGELDMFDLRFPRGSSPLFSFSGHVNSYSQKLAVAVDPAQEFLFAAGQDNKIRSWSLRTGDLITRQGRGDNLFESTYEETLSGMQVIREQEKLSMFISSGALLCKHHLFSQS